MELESNIEFERCEKPEAITGKYYLIDDMKDIEYQALYAA